ncbi:glycosyltransferase family 4 protein [Psychroserpens burtonensis]|uniref:glycosyltransferase family 4 protein n=1 Tax=Psychroserpens burtonensis TaxID=49278 RepID=UPI00040DF607|nr:glycosyltransferase family 4 protein [Psychroserpens burtonensis]
MTLETTDILIITSEFPPQPGGIGNHAYNLALYLSKRHYRVEVIADQRSITGDEERDFDTALPFLVTRIKRTRRRSFMYLQRILTTRKRCRTASHIIATGKFSLWNIGFLNVRKAAKTMAIIHGTEVNLKSFFLRKSIDLALQKFNTIVAVSNYTKGLVAHLNKKVVVIPNGIDVDQWSANIAQQPLKGQPSLITVGRVSSRKGQLNVIKRLPELVKRFPELHYHCVGIPTEAEYFIKEAEALHVGSYVTFHGSVSAAILKQMLGATDLFVMLSSESVTGDVEGFGIAILEANALGIPAIGAKGCGIEDAISDGHSGLLINGNSTKDFETALVTILSHKATYRMEAKKWAQQHDWTLIINQYLALLE